MPVAKDKDKKGDGKRKPGSTSHKALGIRLPEPGVRTASIRP